MSAKAYIEQRPTTITAALTIVLIGAAKRLGLDISMDEAGAVVLLLTLAVGHLSPRNLQRGNSAS